MTFDPGNRLIVAMDLPNREEARVLLEKLEGIVEWVKVGLELYLAEGPSLVEEFVKKGFRVMLDLKLHDIPKTVERSTRRVAGLGAELLTVHTSGGAAMMESAVRAGESSSLGILGVTVLTSLSKEDILQVGGDGDIPSLVNKRAAVAKEAGCLGVVASPLEASILSRMGDLVIVTPGIRPVSVDNEDQKRVMTPAKARAEGADMLVVGRAIRDATDPGAAARAILAEMESRE